MMPKYKVTINRTSFQEATAWVKADNAAEAEDEAMRGVGALDFHETDSECEVGDVELDEEGE